MKTRKNNRGWPGLLLLAGILLLLTGGGGACQEQGEREKSLEFKLKGYCSSLWVFLAPGGGGGGQTLGTNRLRLETDTFYKKKLHLKLITDLEGFAGNMVSSPAWGQMSNGQAGSYWNLSTGKKASDSLYLRSSIYRAYFTYESGSTMFYAGKQRVAWGVMRFWRPTDIFNPESPLQIEGGERVGLDSFRATFPMGRADMDVVYAPSRIPGGDYKAGRLHFVTGDYDVSLIGGRLGQSRVAGLSLDGYIGKGGLRGELLHVKPDGLPSYCLWTIGSDYTFPSSLTLTAEYLNNGGAIGLAPTPLLPFEGIISTRRRQLAALGISQQINPLMTGSVFTSYDLEGKSMAFGPRFTWDFRKNLEISFGGVLFGGEAGGEYSGNPNAYFAQVKYYF